MPEIWGKLSLLKKFYDIMLPMKGVAFEKRVILWLKLRGRGPIIL
jgi:hypothetical protein